MNEPKPSEERLSILYLLCLTAGVAFAISAVRGIEFLRFPADELYYNLSANRLDPFAVLVATVYGVCVTTAIFAWRSGHLWDSPGKILALLFAAMCVLNWTLELFAAVLVNYQMQEPLPVGTTDTRGFIAGTWYRNFASSFGYLAGLPILALVVYRTRTQRFSWRMVWIGFFIFAVLIIGASHLGFGGFLPMWLRAWYFEFALGIPVALMAIALCLAISRREPVDWWTAATAPLIMGAWGIGIALKATAT